jgi:glycosyltransferase involved in cell wall biosynthesis
VHHAVINSVAREQLAFRAGVSVRLVPNVMDFEHPPGPPEAGRTEVREALGLAGAELLVLQPTRVVQRKGIEHAIELVRRLDRPARIIVSHSLDDEGDGYVRRVREYAALLEVPMEFAGDRIADGGGVKAPGVLDLGDVYQAADLVTYPSTYEGFGNALLEAIYYRRPLVVNSYSIYGVDIKPKGFDMIEFDDYVTLDTLDRVLAVLDNPDEEAAMTTKNYGLGARYFSYQVLRTQLTALLHSCLGT